MSINMKKEIRAELKILRRSHAKVRRDFDRQIAANLRAITKLNTKHLSLCNQADRYKNKFSKREAILQGRLS